MIEKKKLAVLLFIVLIAIFLPLELIVRFLEYKEYKKQSENSIKDNGYNNIFISVTELPYLYDHKPNIRYTLSNKNDEYTIITNSTGLREKKDYANLSSSIIFLGDSIVEGSSAENHETLDSNFERLTNIVSLNFGLSATNTVHQLEYLKYKYNENYNTKIVILGFCLNDLETNNYKIYYDTKFKNWQLYEYINLENENKSSTYYNDKNLKIKNIFQSIKNFIRNNSRLAYRLVSTYHKKKISRNFALNPYLSTETNLIYTEKPIYELQKFVNSINAKLFVVIFPYETQILYNLKRKDIIAPQSQQQVIDILKKFKIDYYDPYNDMLKEYKSEENIDLFYDNSHPNPKGYNFIANKIYQIMKKRNIL